MKKYLLGLLLLAGLVTCALPVRSDTPVVSYTATSLSAPQALPWLALSGQNSCSFSVIAISGSPTFTIVPQGSADRTQTIATVSAIGGGAVTATGITGGAVGPTALTNFRGNITALSGGTIQVTQTCSSASSGGGSGSGNTTIVAPTNAAGQVIVTTPGPFASANIFDAAGNPIGAVQASSTPFPSTGPSSLPVVSFNYARNSTGNWAPLQLGSSHAGGDALDVVNCNVSGNGGVCTNPTANPQGAAPTGNNAGNVSFNCSNNSGSYGCAVFGDTPFFCPVTTTLTQCIPAPGAGLKIKITALTAIGYETATGGVIELKTGTGANCVTGTATMAQVLVMPAAIAGPGAYEAGNGGGPVYIAPLISAVCVDANAGTIGVASVSGTYALGI